MLDVEDAGVHRGRSGIGVVAGARQRERARAVLDQITRTRSVRDHASKGGGEIVRAAHRQGVPVQGDASRVGSAGIRERADSLTGSDGEDGTIGHIHRSESAKSGRVVGLESSGGDIDLSAVHQAGGGTAEPQGASATHGDRAGSGAVIERSQDQGRASGRNEGRIAPHRGRAQGNGGGGDARGGKRVRADGEAAQRQRGEGAARIQRAAGGHVNAIVQGQRGEETAARCAKQVHRP